MFRYGHRVPGSGDLQVATTKGWSDGFSRLVRPTIFFESQPEYLIFGWATNVGQTFLSAGSTGRLWQILFRCTHNDPPSPAPAKMGGTLACSARGAASPVVVTSRSPPRKAGVTASAVSFGVRPPSNYNMTHRRRGSTRRRDTPVARLVRLRRQ